MMEIMENFWFLLMGDGGAVGNPGPAAGGLM